MSHGAMDMEQQAEVFDKLTELHGTVKAVIAVSNGKPSPMALDLLSQVAALQEVFAPEEVTVDSTPAEGGSSAIGWAIMGGLSVALYRASDSGELTVGLEIVDDQKEIPVVVKEVNSERVWWRGKVGS